MIYKSTLALASKLSLEDKILLAEQLNQWISNENDLVDQNELVDDSNKVYTIAQAAVILDASRATVVRWFDSGRLRGYRISGKRIARIKHEELAKFLQKRKLSNLISKPKTPAVCYTTAQAAKIVGVTPATILRWVRRGKLRGYFIPGSQDRRIEHENLVAFAEKQGRVLNKCA